MSFTCIHPGFGRPYPIVQVYLMFVMPFTRIPSLWKSIGSTYAHNVHGHLMHVTVHDVEERCREGIVTHKAKPRRVHQRVSIGIRHEMA